jgi:hypothetical protein
MPLPDRQQSGWLDFLDWVKQPGQAGLSVLSGRGRAAAHHLEDFLAGPLNVLPGVHIPHQAKPEEEAHASELLGMDKGSTASRYADLIGDVIANPITWTALIPGVGKAVNKGLVQAGKVAYQAAKKVRLGDEHTLASPIDTVRRAAGWNTVADVLPVTHRGPESVAKAPDGVFTNPQAKVQDAVREFRPGDTLRRSEGVNKVVSDAAKGDIKQMLTEHQPTADEDRALAQIIDNRTVLPNGDHAVLDRTNYDIAGDDRLRALGNAQNRVESWMKANPHEKVDPAKLKSLLERTHLHSEKLQDELIGQGLMKPGQKVTGMYRKRLIFGENTSVSDVGKTREWKTADDLVNGLNSHKDSLRIDESWIRSLAMRAEAQGAKLGKAALEHDLMGGDRRWTNALHNDAHPLHTDAVAYKDQVIKDLRQHKDTYDRFRFELEPKAIDKWENVTRSMLAPFKAAAVFGAGPFVRMGGTFRNGVSNVLQMATTSEGRKILAQDPTMFFKALWKGVDDAAVHNFTGNRIAADKITNTLDLYDRAALASGGDQVGLRAKLAGALKMAPAESKLDIQHLIEAADNGVLNGFANSAQMRNEIVGKNKWYDPRKWLIPGRSKVSDMGGKLFQGLESHFRFTTFKGLRTQGKSPAEAAKLIEDMFFPYGYSSAENRQLRLIMPFAQYMTQAMAQSAKFLSKNPAVLPVAAAFFGDQGQPAPGYAKEQAGIPIPGGKAVGFGAPMEAFNTIPAFANANSLEGFTESAKPLVSAMNPLIGMGIGLATGVDTWSGKPYLENSRIPGTNGDKRPRNEADTIYGLLEDSGLIQPLSGPITQAKSLGKMDSAGQASLRWATGINPVTPDPLKVKREDLTAQLKQAGAPQFADYYNPGNNDDMAQAIDALRATRKSIKDKAALQAAIMPIVSKEIAKEEAHPPLVDRSHHVPYLAGAGKDERTNTVFIDKGLPKQFKTSSGRVFDAAKYLHVHEHIEQQLMDNGLSYDQAHDIAEKSEHMAVAKDGIDPKEYEALLRPWIKNAKRDSGRKGHNQKVPVALEPRPYIQEGDRKDIAKMAF